MRYKLELETRSPQLGPPVHVPAANRKAPAVARGSGLAHFEKNWGLGFPQRWHWAQAINASVAPAAAAGPAAAPAAGGKSARSQSSGNSTGLPAASAAAFVLAGGQPPTPLLPAGLLRLLPDVWILGVRAPGYRWATQLPAACLIPHACVPARRVCSPPATTATTDGSRQSRC